MLLICRSRSIVTGTGYWREKGGEARQKVAALLKVIQIAWSRYGPDLTTTHDEVLIVSCGAGYMNVLLYMHTHMLPAHARSKARVEQQQSSRARWLQRGSMLHML